MWRGMQHWDQVITAEAFSVSPTHEELDGGTCMDTGKIMIGTALLLITIGLLVHPAGAQEPGDIPTGGLGSVSENPGSVPGSVAVQPVQNLHEPQCGCMNV